LDNVIRAIQLSREQIDRRLWSVLAAQVEGGVGPSEHRLIESSIRSHPAMKAEIEKENAQISFLYECEDLTHLKISQLLDLPMSKSEQTHRREEEPPG
jgi:hypothetical protein